jgi:hypothetical protein
MRKAQQQRAKYSHLSVSARKTNIHSKSSNAKANDVILGSSAPITAENCPRITEENEPIYSSVPHTAANNEKPGVLYMVN